MIFDQKWDSVSEMSLGTRTTVRMEEQMALLMNKLDEQSEQIKRLTERQSAQLEDIERRQQQMEKQVIALMEGQRATQEACHEPKQDEPADTLGSPHGWSGYQGLVPTAIQKPLSFDGSVPWDTYKLQFDTIAKMNHWEEQDKQRSHTVRDAILEEDSKDEQLSEGAIRPYIRSVEADHEGDKTDKDTGRTPQSTSPKDCDLLALW